MNHQVIQVGSGQATSNYAAAKGGSMLLPRGQLATEFYNKQRRAGQSYLKWSQWLSPNNDDVDQEILSSVSRKVTSAVIRSQRHYTLRIHLPYREPN